MNRRQLMKMALLAPAFALVPAFADFDDRTVQWFGKLYPTSQWHMYTQVRKGGVTTYYIDGEKVSFKFKIPNPDQFSHVAHMSTWLTPTPPSQDSIRRLAKAAL